MRYRMIPRRLQAVLLGVVARWHGFHVEVIKRFVPIFPTESGAFNAPIWRVTLRYPEGHRYARATVFAEGIIEAIVKIRRSA